MLLILLFVMIILFVYINNIIYSLDISDYFHGAKQRPKIEILYPENGIILDHNEIEIKVSIKGYIFPSNFHDSSVCIGLSSNEIFIEECFIEAPELKFHVSGLTADRSYSLRVIFFERKEAIAVSVRNFRVGGIKLNSINNNNNNNNNNIVTIKTAVQLALSYQLHGNYDEAKKIYDNILTIDPSHPYTLHILGLNELENGNTENALLYLNKALLAIKQSTKTLQLLPSEIEGYDGFYRSLGECYRILGRYSEAEDHFLTSLKINPDQPYVTYNLGVLYQTMNDWNNAILLYQDVINIYINNKNKYQFNKNFTFTNINNTNTTTTNNNTYNNNSNITNITNITNVTNTILNSSLLLDNIDNNKNENLIIEKNEELNEIFLNAKIRECDLLQTIYFSSPNNFNINNYFNNSNLDNNNNNNNNQIIANCWLQGIQLFPNNHIMYNELGNLLLRVGQYADAIPFYQNAVNLGNNVAQINLAHILETMGYTKESKELFQSLVSYAMNSDNLPYTHFLLRQITVSPRILPLLDNDIIELRKQMNLDLDLFLALDSKSDNFHIDNSAPLHFGFHTGYYLTFQINSLLNNTIINHIHKDYNNKKSTSLLMENNVLLKIKLYHAYLKYCPALSQGVFVDALGKNYKDSINNTIYFTKDDYYYSINDIHDTNNTNNTNNMDFNKNKNINYFKILSNENDEVYLRMHAEGGVRILNIVTNNLNNNNNNNIDENIHTVIITTSTLNQLPYSSSIEFAKRKYIKKIYRNNNELLLKHSINNNNNNNNIAITSNIKKHNTIKIGFISRFFRIHAIGFLMQGIIQKLSEYEEYEVYIFLIGEKDIYSSLKNNNTSFKKTKYYDSVQLHIITHADYTYYLSTDISEISQFIKTLLLDIIIYPEIGIDPICYFLSFSRLATIQAAFLGHPDTTGISTIDYFITSDMMPEFLIEAEKQYQLNITNITDSTNNNITNINRYKGIDKKQAKLLYEKQQKQLNKNKDNKDNKDYKDYKDYNKNNIEIEIGSYKSFAPSIATSFTSSYSEENVYILHNIGTFFIDIYSDYANLLHESPRTVLLDRSKFIEYLHLPKTAHLLLLAQPLYKLHNIFDETIAKILIQDRLAYLIIIDSVNVTSWQQLYINRLSSKYNFDVKERILFFISTTMEDTLTAMAAAHVLLDPFPVSGYLSILQALSIGLPVVTLPSNSLVGRMGLILYNMLEYYDLICNNIQDYINKIHNITHNPKIRLNHVNSIILNRHKFFNNITINNTINDWRIMIHHMINNNNNNNIN